MSKKINDKYLKINSIMNTLKNASSINYMSIGEPYSTNNCPNCHRPYWDMGESTAPIMVCECWKQNYPIQPSWPAPVQMGWKCPACNGGVAPGVERCPCTPIPFTLSTWTTTGEFTIGRDGTVSENQPNENKSNKTKRKRTKK